MSADAEGGDCPLQALDRVGMIRRALDAGGMSLRFNRWRNDPDWYWSVEDDKQRGVIGGVVIPEEEWPAPEALRLAATLLRLTAARLEELARDPACFVPPNDAGDVKIRVPF